MRQETLPFDQDEPRPIPPKAERRPIRMNLPTTTRIMRAHLKLFHGVWISPSADLAEMYDCHRETPADLPHVHPGDKQSNHSPEDTGDHGFW